jgi:hypothetical protein
MRKWLLPLVAVALATTTVVFWLLWRQEHARANALQSIDDVPREPDPQATVAASSSDRSSRSAGEAAFGGTEASTDEGGGTESSFSDEYRLLQDDAYREAYRKHRILELTRGHIDMTRVLGISKANADRLLSLQVDREIQYLSVPHRNPRTEEELQTRMIENERRQRDEDAEIGAIIGDNNVARWHAYQDSLPLRHEVRAVGRELAQDGAPLRDEQVDALVEVMSAERRRTQVELGQFAAGLTPSDGLKAKMQGYRDARRVELEHAAEDRIRSAANRILTPEQMTVFIETRRRWQEAMDAEVAMYRAADDARRRLGDSP